MVEMSAYLTPEYSITAGESTPLRMFAESVFLKLIAAIYPEVDLLASAALIFS